MKVGDIVGNYEILSNEIRQWNGKRRRVAKVKCLSCAKDKEMFGEAIFFVEVVKGGFRFITCGCNPNYRKTEYQWALTVKRKAEKEGKIFLGFVSTFSGNKTKVRLKCKVHNHIYESCTVANFMRDRDCPLCARDSKAKKRSLTDRELESLYFETGAFHEGTSFKRLSGRVREVYCPVCEDSFKADHSNLVMGKNPCNCKDNGTGTKMETYFYKIRVCGDKEFIGFGVTRFPKRRYIDHKYTLKLHNCIIEEYRVFLPTGETSSKRLEGELKGLKKNTRTGINSFNLEAFSKEDEQEIDSLLIKYGFTLQEDMSV